MYIYIMLRQNGRAGYSHQKKKKCHIKSCPEMSGFGVLNERLHSTISTLYMQYFISNRRNVVTVHVPNVITVGLLLFFRLQFTTNSQHVLHLNQCTN